MRDIRINIIPNICYNFNLEAYHLNFFIIIPTTNKPNIYNIVINLSKLLYDTPIDFSQDIKNLLTKATNNIEPNPIWDVVCMLNYNDDPDPGIVLVISLNGFNSYGNYKFGISSKNNAFDLSNYNSSSLYNNGYIINNNISTTYLRKLFLPYYGYYNLPYNKDIGLNETYSKLTDLYSDLTARINQYIRNNYNSVANTIDPIYITSDSKGNTIISTNSNFTNNINFIKEGLSKGAINNGIYDMWFDVQSGHTPLGLSSYEIFNKNISTSSNSTSSNSNWIYNNSIISSYPTDISKWNKTDLILNPVNYCYSLNKDNGIFSFTALYYTSSFNNYQNNYKYLYFFVLLPLNSDANINSDIVYNSTNPIFNNYQKINFTVELSKSIYNDYNDFKNDFNQALATSYNNALQTNSNLSNISLKATIVPNNDGSCDFNLKLLKMTIDSYLIGIDKIYNQNSLNYLFNMNYISVSTKGYGINTDLSVILAKSYMQTLYVDLINNYSLPKYLLSDLNNKIKVINKAKIGLDNLNYYIGLTLDGYTIIYSNVQNIYVNSSISFGFTGKEIYNYNGCYGTITSTNKANLINNSFDLPILTKILNANRPTLSYNMNSVNNNIPTTPSFSLSNLIPDINNGYNLIPDINNGSNLIPAINNGSNLIPTTPSFSLSNLIPAIDNGSNLIPAIDNGSNLIPTNNNGSNNSLKNLYSSIIIYIIIFIITIILILVIIYAIKNYNLIKI